MFTLSNITHHLICSRQSKAKSRPKQKKEKRKRTATKSCILCPSPATFLLLQCCCPRILYLASPLEKTKQCSWGEQVSTLPHPLGAVTCIKPDLISQLCSSEKVRPVFSLLFQAKTLGPPTLGRTFLRKTSDTLDKISFRYGAKRNHFKDLGSHCLHRMGQTLDPVSSLKLTSLV